MQDSMQPSFPFLSEAARVSVASSQRPSTPRFHPLSLPTYLAQRSAISPAACVGSFRTTAVDCVCGFAANSIAIELVRAAKYTSATHSVIEAHPGVVEGLNSIGRCVLAPAPSGCSKADAFMSARDLIVCLYYSIDINLRSRCCVIAAFGWSGAMLLNRCCGFPRPRALHDPDSQSP